MCQDFDGHGTFEGQVTGFDGDHYQVYYSADEDEEDLSENEFETLELLPEKGNLLHLKTCSHYEGSFESSPEKISSMMGFGHVPSSLDSKKRKRMIALENWRERNKQHFSVPKK